MKGITEVTQNETGLIFHTPTGPVFEYNNLVVLDARGNVLESEVQVTGDDNPQVALVIIGEGEFPLVIS